MKIIDMHGHHGHFKGFSFYRSDTESMIREMDRNGVETLVLSSHRALFTPDGNLEGTLPALKESHGRFRGYWVIHPHRPDEFKTQIERFEELREYFIGFKLISSYHRYSIDGPNYQYMLDYANAHRLPVLMHTWENDKFNGYDNCRNICDRYKKFTFLMGHSGFSDYPRFAQLARDYSNAYCELTATYALDGAIEDMVKTAGSEKVLFGTDQPWFDSAYGIGCILHSRISHRDRDNIFYNNGAAILSETSI